MRASGMLDISRSPNSSMQVFGKAQTQESDVRCLG